MEPEVDLIADLNAEDDDGLGWSTLSDARDAADVRPDAMLIAALWPETGRPARSVIPGRTGL